MVIKTSKDGGKSWKDMGLKKSEHISKIIVHPDDPNTVWVASQGPLWSPGGERGLFKTTNGGKTWKNTLDINEWTGVTDLVIDPNNPNILYAASWQKHRNVAALIGGGPGTSLYKSVDGGDNCDADADCDAGDDGDEDGGADGDDDGDDDDGEDDEEEADEEAD